MTGTTSATVTANGDSYNGGGPASFYASNSTGGGGGGATDVRLVSGSWSDTTSLNSRIIVAGGGGGAKSHNNAASYSGSGGSGGTLNGGNGQHANNTCYAYGNGGIQNAGGGSTTCPTDGHDQTDTSLFGYGWYTYTYTYHYQGTNTVSVGGGGGYYGGGIGYHAPSGGGSNFISGYAGANAITSESNRTHKNDPLHYSNKYFVNGTMTAGTNSGNGKAKISYYGENEPERINIDLNNVRYIKDCINGSSANTDNHWVELQAIKNGVNLALSKQITGTSSQNNDTTNSYSYITDGLIDNISGVSGYGMSLSTGMQCVTVDLESTYDLDEIAVWHYYIDGRTYNDNVTYVSSDNNEWIEVIRNDDAETSNGNRVTAWDRSIRGVYKINYYQGNGTSTNGATKIGTSTCIYGESCTLKTYAELGATFPESSSANNTSSTYSGCDHYWSFAGWNASTTGTSIEYTNGQTFTFDSYNNLNLYAVGVKTWYFYSGANPTAPTQTLYQYWNPYSTSTAYLTTVTIPAATAISTWTFIGYRAGSDTPSSTVTFAANTVNISQKPAYDVCRYVRGVYSRTLTINYQANGGSGSTSATTATQYYNTNTGISNNVSTPSFTLSANGFTAPTGMAFSKWADGSTSGTQYAAGATYTAWVPAVGTTTVTKNMYAIWQGNITCCWIDSVKHNRACSGEWQRSGDYCSCYLYNQTSCPSGFGNSSTTGCYNFLTGGYG